MAAEVEDKRMRELCGQYSGLLSYKRSGRHKSAVGWKLQSRLPGQTTRMRRKLKKEMDKDEESYMEMFI